MRIKEILLKMQNLFIIKKIFLYEGTRAQFQNELNKLLQSRKSIDGFNAALDNERTYKMSPAISWGTMKFAPITVCLEYVPLRDDIQGVTIYTAIRPEVLFLAIIFPVLTISVVSLDNISTLMVPLVMIATIIWFNFISKMQEKSLIKKVKLKLGLIESRNKDLF